MVSSLRHLLDSVNKTHLKAITNPLSSGFYRKCVTMPHHSQMATHHLHVKGKMKITPGIHVISSLTLLRTTS